MDGGLPIGEDERKVVAWAVASGTAKHEPIWIPRGPVGPDDVRFELLFCGICHSDIHVGKDDFKSTKFPFVGGHELAGKVLEVGANVTRFAVGDSVGVGCMVDSCLNCTQCNQQEEQYCDNGFTGTWNSDRKHGRVPGNKTLPTYGGYSEETVVHERFVFKIPDSLPIEVAGPILCAGITMYDPLKHWGAAGEQKLTVGIIGIGGLGTMGIKLAKALGNDVVAISSSAAKEQLARDKGATHYCVAKDPESMKAHAGKCDLILNTVSAVSDVQGYLTLLSNSGTMVMLGIDPNPNSFSTVPLIF